ncbi:MAG: [protein-PII] uridylyltransferase [Candidatus Nanopelagicales bacterium]
MDYRSGRDGLIVDASLSAERRSQQLVALTDAWLHELFAESGAPDQGWTLLGVGGYGRGGLAPGSDVDIVLLTPDHHDPQHVSTVADGILYPMWDAGVRIDHSVRSVRQSRELAQHDLRVAMGLLDGRVIAGDQALGTGLVSAVLGDWRASARVRLPQLKQMADDRRVKYGDVAHALEPDLKEGYGGLREATLMRAVAASWISDVPRTGLADAFGYLTAVRDRLQVLACVDKRTPSNRLLLQDQDAVAEAMGIVNADALLQQISGHARTVSYASDVLWQRTLRLLRKPQARRLQRRVRMSAPVRTPIASGIVRHQDEISIAATADVAGDTGLTFRLATAAATSNTLLSPSMMGKIAQAAPAIPEPWSEPDRNGFIELLSTGRGLIGAWEALDSALIPQRWIPEWSAVRSQPQRNALHTFTVDRHLVETAANAGAFVNRVDRPDLLVVGALLHDIGKGRHRDHTEVGMELVASIAPRMGFGAADTRTLIRLVEHHLLLPDAATRRDLDDPATIRMVAEAVEDGQFLDLLHALTVSDAMATGPAAWSDWKASLVDTLVARVHAKLGDDSPSRAAEILTREESNRLEQGVGTSVEWTVGPWLTVSIATDDRTGLLADLASVFAWHRLDVHAANTYTHGDRVLMRWQVSPAFGELPSADQVRQDIVRTASGDLDLSPGLLRREPVGVVWTTPHVEFVANASDVASVLQVRTYNRPALVHTIARAVVSAGASVRAARISTLGSTAVDVFYLAGLDGGLLTDSQQISVSQAVRAALAIGASRAG